MDYQALAEELMGSMYILRQAKPHKQLNRSMQGECFVLQYIAHHGDSVQPSEISNIMGISSARIAAVLNVLGRKGLITREFDPDDRRKVLVNLTENGKAKATAQTREVLDKTIVMLKLLGEEDAKEFVRLIKKLVELMPQFRYADDK